MNQQPQAKTLRWFQAIQEISPYIVRIETPESSGTGFFVAQSDDGKFIGIATAAHVVDRLSQWPLPLKIFHHDSAEFIIFEEKDRHIILDPGQDTALVVVARSKVIFPDKLINLIDDNYHLKMGVGIGWLGYPGMLGSKLCFFSGNISAVEAGKFYYIDGVAINGVSGGPVFYTNTNGELNLVGLISAYMPNQINGGSLPGLAVARDVTSLRQKINEFKDLVAPKI